MIGSFTVIGLQKGIDKLTKYFNDWSLVCNLKRPKYYFVRRETN
jgi:hypothetical protein